MADTDNHITDEELQILEAATSSDEWNAACDRIKRNRDGAYPPDWWPKVKLSGLLDRVFARFGSSPEIKIVPVRHRR